MVSDDDTAYKQLFAHPPMVRELLLGFVAGEWVRQLDFSTLERINGSYISDSGDHRHGDMVWRVRLAGEWIYIYLLLEFQSRSDPWMALRMAQQKGGFAKHGRVVHAPFAAARQEA
jgi:predicted transposase YdaD